MEFCQWKSQYLSCVTHGQFGLLIIDAISLLPASLLVADTQLCSCTVGGEERGVREQAQGLGQVLGCRASAEEEEMPGTGASPRCPVQGFLTAFQCAPAHCWRLTDAGERGGRLFPPHQDGTAALWEQHHKAWKGVGSKRDCVHSSLEGSQPRKI